MQHLTRFQDVAFQAVQFHDLGIAASFAEVLLGDFPQRVAVFDRVRSAGGFGFRRDGFAGESVIILLHGRKERVPMGQNVNGTALLRVKIFVGVDIRLGIDGTKLESRAGRYTFCWRGTVEKNLAKVKQTVLKETGLKTLRGLQNRLSQTKPTVMVSGKGKHKSREQRDWEALDALRMRWEGYAESLEIMGKTRNSYSKADPDATFMRMKEDHMRNGQLKPGYNVQIGVNSEYITGIEVFTNRTDYGTLEPFLQEMKRKQGKKYEKVTADAGYESLDNYLYLEENGQISFIKPQNHDAKKTKKYRSQIGRADNMDYDTETDTYTCVMGKTLFMYRESKDKYSKHNVTVSHYRCEDCTGCPRRKECCKAANSNKPKELRVRKQYEQKRAASEENINTQEGVYLRLCRSIQVEGAFGLLKNDFGFRRFLTRGKRNVRTELFLLGLGFNLKKLWKKQQTGRLHTHLSVLSSA